jgi:hypothetical protein
MIDRHVRREALWLHGWTSNEFRPVPRDTVGTSGALGIITIESMEMIAV